jgi:hypothetical protein
MAKITVTAGEGRTFPVHHTIATAPGGALQLLRPGDELEVDDSHTSIQRALRIAAEPGLDAALELAWMYLLSVDLGIGTQVADPRFVEEDEIIADNDKTIWQQTWRVWLTRDVDQLRASVQKLTGLRTTLKPTGDEPSARHVAVDSNV